MGARLLREVPEPKAVAFRAAEGHGSEVAEADQLDRHAVRGRVVEKRPRRLAPLVRHRHGPNVHVLDPAPADEPVLGEVRPAPLEQASDGTEAFQLRILVRVHPDVPHHRQFAFAVVVGPGRQVAQVQRQHLCASPENASESEAAILGDGHLQEQIGVEAARRNMAHDGAMLIRRKI